MPRAASAQGAGAGGVSTAGRQASEDVRCWGWREGSDAVLD